MTAEQIRANLNGQGELRDEDGNLSARRIMLEQVAQLAELNAFLREARVMLVRQGGPIPNGIPIIGGSGN